MKDKSGLTVKQKLFCERYIANGYNASEAAREAGYSPISAHSIGQENTRKPEIRNYLGNRMKELIEKAGAGIDWRIQMLKKTADACFNGEADREGKVHPSGIIGAISELNKMEGAYAANKQEVEITSTEQKPTKELIDKFTKEF